MSPLSIGIDIGTTAVKVIALDEEGNVVFSDQLCHDVISLHPGWAEEDPAVWWEHVDLLMQRLAESVDARRIAVIGCTGMVPTLICLDEEGQHLGTSIQQNDMRAAGQLEAMTRDWDVEDYFQRTGTRPNTQHIYPKLLWLQENQPEVLLQCRTCLGSYDYIVYRLTGKLGTERNWALESGMWDYRTEGWIPALLESLPVSADVLPPVRSSTEMVGTLKEDLAAEWGMPAGVPVIAGSADHVASAFSTGCLRDGDLVLKLGGAGDILAYSSTVVCDPRLFLDYHCYGGGFLLNGCMAASGAALKWFQATFSAPDFMHMDDEADRVAPGSEGVVVLPYFLGEKTPIFDPDARGVLFGLSLGHTRAHIYRAFLESVAYAFRHHVDVMRERGLTFKRVFITNGGSRSTLWRQILADVLGMDLQYVKNHPGSSLGAAVLGGLAAGLWKADILDSILSDCIHIRHEESRKEAYEKSYRLYRSLYPILKESFEANMATSPLAHHTE